MNSLKFRTIAVTVATLSLASGAIAFDSGSTGTQDFTPTVSTEIPLPENGVLQYRNVSIPSGVTITFKKNTTNTPVVMLASGDVTIAGTINVSGTNSTPVGTAGDGNIFDDGQPGRGGPGGFDGGAGGKPSTNAAERIGGGGLGPGGSVPDPRSNYCPAAGGGFGGFGDHGGIGCPGGSPYGSAELAPLVGGSGSAGGNSNGVFHGAGGGAGGGAILIACTGTFTLLTGGVIVANGGGTGAVPVFTLSGGGGSGGAIRLVATRFAGANGTLSATGGRGGLSSSSGTGNGGSGRVRIEADLIGSLPGVNVGSQNSVANGTGSFSTGPTSPVFFASSPTLRIVNVGGVPVPELATGNNDVTLTASVANPVIAALATSGVPVGSLIRVSATPLNGSPISVNSTPTAGSLAIATASASLDIPVGQSTLQSSVTFTITAVQGEALSKFASGERVEKVTLTTTMGQGSAALLETGSGKTFEVPAEVFALAGMPQ